MSSIVIQTLNALLGVGNLEFLGLLHVGWEDMEVWVNSL